MRAALSVILLWVAVYPAVGQSSTANYRVATIMAVNANHPDRTTRRANPARYVLSVQVGNTLYDVLYTPPPGTIAMERVTGRDLLVRVGSDTITFNDLVGRTSEVPILRSEALLPENDFDLAQAPGKYFSLKYDILSRRLNLAPSQQAQLRPILEQEVGELGEIPFHLNVVSLDTQVQMVEKIMYESDLRLEPVLSAQQWHTLQGMRKDQEQQLRRFGTTRKER
jgi:hypothetical protein